jgi:hypothetical protein
MSDPYQGIEKITVSEPLLKTQCILGEGEWSVYIQQMSERLISFDLGPLYDPRTNTLHFVDILRNHVYNYHLESKDLTIHEYTDPVSALAIRADGPGVSIPRFEAL